MFGDLKMTDDGDLEQTFTGDLTMVTRDAAFIQAVLFRLKTVKGDWVLSPNVGADLEDFVGKPNTHEIRILIRERVRDALQYKGLLIDPNVSVLPLKDPNQVLIVVSFPSIDVPGTSVKVLSAYDFREGLVYQRVLKSK